MIEAWRTRALVLAGAIVVVEVVMVVAGMGPRLMLVAALGIVAAAVVWLALDLGDTVEPAVWRAQTRQPSTAIGADSRTRLIRMRLSSRHTDEHTVELLQTSLVGLIDDRLLTEHGVDRSLDPVVAQSIIGPELTRFVNGQTSSKTLSDPRGLAHIVTLIENV